MEEADCEVAVLSNAMCDCDLSCLPFQRSIRELRDSRFSLTLPITLSKSDAISAIELPRVRRERGRDNQSRVEVDGRLDDEGFRGPA